MKRQIFCLAIAAMAILSCKKEASETAQKLGFYVEFDPLQARLNNIGLPAELPLGHAAQTPDFEKMSIHYIELAPDAFTPLGSGAVLYKGAETSAGGEVAVDFDKAIQSGNGELMTEINLKDVPPGSYEWVRTSVTYQNYRVGFNLKGVPVLGDLDGQSGTVASFVGFNTYIGSLRPDEQTIAVNDDKKQGFWAFETSFSAPYDVYNSIVTGEAPVGATTVVNPLFQSSPIPAGSCVVTGRLAEPLVITGREKQAVKLVLSYSVNQSFEWVDTNGNGQFDLYANDPSQNERVVDMGLRGLLPKVE